jgi:hypothetical protein
MLDYRLYFLDSRGHIGGVVELACADDDEASQQAEAHSDGRAMELWNRDRKVARFCANDASPSQFSAGRRIDLRP